MKKTLLKKIKYLLLTSFLLLTSQIEAQNTPFNCDYSAYLFQYNDVYALDLASGSSYLVGTDITEGNINATGYNPKDGYIWGAVSTPNRSIIRIGKDFSTQIFSIDELSPSNSYIGDVSSEGIYYLMAGGKTLYKIDLDPESPTYLKSLGSNELPENLNIHDWAFNAVDGQLYTVERNSNHLYRINPSTYKITDLGEVPILSGLKYTYGAVYFDSEGRFYVSANQTGTIYIIQSVQNLTFASRMNSNLFAFGPSSNSNDGARCPTAPVPQEDCINGVDDDGDGLVDCDDPACSGISACPVLVPIVSGGNDGGLESNDRLSQQINQRNYLRNKASYTFNKSTAKKVSKSKAYKQAKTKGNFGLGDLIPLGVIEGATAIETSPTDLINITNATELYSVDYVKNNETVAVVLATKTEEAVYEHTKYICDRLLGAELISVSTIILKEQTFIKSIIKNSDGSMEFVVSFAGKIVDNDNSFAIESHWNIDKYTKGVPLYNFQIWTNKIDDLVLLSEEILSLFEAQKPISSYNNSTPPPVFVKKGKYINGTLELELVNTNKSKTIQVDAGLKRTETSITENTSNQINLNDGFITDMVLETGALFDIGFRILNETNETPDDLFMSDGPWGVDISTEGSVLNEYKIEENDNTYAGNGLRIERNLSLNATTKSYISAYRAFTPRFVPVSLTDYNVLEFDAEGNGEVEITITKKGISNWEEQYKAKVILTHKENHYQIPYSYFESTLKDPLVLNDAVNLIFTLSSDGINAAEKEAKIKNLEFSKKEIFGNPLAKNEAVMYPNPLVDRAEIGFYSEIAANCDFKIYNLSGSLVKSFSQYSDIGHNQVELLRDGLTRGIYFLRISNNYRTYDTIKLIVN